MADLGDLQRRFYAIATGAAPAADATELLAGDPARIEIYRSMYRDRLIDAIAADYPKLVSVLGEVWPEVATAYLRACPPAHPDIREAGRRLGEYLANDGRRYEAELARLEWARADVFYGPDATPLARERLAALDPAEFPTVRLVMVPAHAIVTLASNADARWSAIEDGQPPPPPAAGARTVVVWRRGTVTVVHRTVDVDEAACIAMLAAGTRFAEICEALAGAADPAARAIELLIRWIDAELLSGAL
ncbi:MAG: putative DNA-binding domain-containing protein [Kofleriaceae bacterium]